MLLWWGTPRTRTPPAKRQAPRKGGAKIGRRGRLAWESAIAGSLAERRGEASWHRRRGCDTMAAGWKRANEMTMQQVKGEFEVNRSADPVPHVALGFDAAVDF